jgi:hypothetical protein
MHYYAHILQLPLIVSTRELQTSKGANQEDTLWRVGDT